MRIVISGGGGFIGHHLALALKEDGHKVTVVDSFEVNNVLQYFMAPSSQVREISLRILRDRVNLMRKQGIKIERVDLRNYHETSLALGRANPDVVFHLAAVSHVSSARKDPFRTFDHSQRTLENVLDFCRSGKIRFIYNSSSMVYGPFRRCVTEKSRLNPINVYGALKVGAEKLIFAYGHEFSLPFTIVRPSAVYGPRNVSRSVVQVFIEAAFKGEEVQASEGRLDFTYIDDLIEAYRLILANSLSIGHVFNITYGKSRKISSLVSIVEKEVGRLRVKWEGMDRATPPRGTLSIKKARKVLGYSPKVSLEEGVKRYAAWYRDNHFFGPLS